MGDPLPGWNHNRVNQDPSKVSVFRRLIRNDVAALIGFLGVVGLFSLFGLVGCSDDDRVLRVFVDGEIAISLTTAQLARPLMMNSGAIDEIPGQEQWQEVRVTASDDSAIFPKWSVNYTDRELRAYQEDGRLRVGMFESDGERPMSFIDDAIRVDIKTGAVDFGPGSRKQPDLLMLSDERRTRVEYETLYKLPEVVSDGRSLGWSLQTIMVAYDIPFVYDRVQLQCDDGVLQVDTKHTVYIRLNKRGQWRAMVQSDGPKRTCHQLSQIELLQAAPPKQNRCDDSTLTMTRDGEVFWSGEYETLFDTYQHGVIGMGNRPNRRIVRLPIVIAELTKGSAPAQQITVKACGDKSVEYAWEQIRSGELDLLLVRNRQGMIRLFERPADGRGIRKRYRRINRVEIR